MKSIGSFVICGCVLILTACEKQEPEVIRIPDPLVYDNINQYIVKGPDWKGF